MMEILRILNAKQDILGAKIISEELDKKGYSLGERAVRYHMRILDEKGFTEKVGRKGRQITKKGVDELTKGLIYDQVDFTYSRFEEKMYNVSLDLKTGKGSVIVNLSSINDEESKNFIKNIFSEGLSVSNKFDIKQKDDKTFIETVCGTTIDGVFQQNGIITRPLYGGLVKIEDNEPINFVEQIAYEKTSITPLEAFTGNHATSVLDVINTGTGVIPANFRIIPSVKKEQAIKILDSLDKIGINGLMAMGNSGESVLGVPIPEDMIGIAIVGGVAPLCAAQEEGYDLNIKLADNYAEYSTMKSEGQNINYPFKPASKENNNKISFVLNRIFNIISNIDFDPETASGKVIVNTSYVNKEDVDDTIEILDNLYKNKSEYLFDNKYAVVEDKKDKIGISTICALTIDGILTNKGIYSEPQFSGVLDVETKSPRFIELISYLGSSVDPHEIFIKKGMHDVNGLFDNKGKILASLHTVPYVSRDKTVDILDSLDSTGLNILQVGKPQEYVFNARVDSYHFGYVTSGGLNPLAAVKEQGIPVDVKSIEKVMDYNLFEEL